MTIIDKRRSNDRSARDRRRFIDRVKRKVKDQVDDLATDRKISDMKDEAHIHIPKDDISEPDISYNGGTSQSPIVVSGNDTYGRGDQIKKPASGQGRGSQDADSGEDDFLFTLTKEEFMEILFEDMELPDLVKQAIAEGLDFKWRKAGVVKDGMPSRLNIRKTMENSIARRLASKSGKAPFLDDIDLRYDHRIKTPKPIRHAVVFCIMDVSISMTEYLKDLAKRFFLLFYLFLESSYEKVDIRFIRYHSVADEVDEKKFFYSTETGGTNLPAAFELVNEIIDKDYDISETNIYIGMSSDAEHIAVSLKEFEASCVNAEKEILKLLDKVQYWAYLIVRGNRNVDESRYWGPSVRSVLDAWNEIFTHYKKGKALIAFERKDIYPALRDLFKKGKRDE